MPKPNYDILNLDKEGIEYVENEGTEGYCRVREDHPIIPVIRMEDLAHLKRFPDSLYRVNHHVVIYAIHKVRQEWQNPTVQGLTQFMFHVDEDGSLIGDVGELDVS